jgi:hypothetical protein
MGAYHPSVAYFENRVGFSLVIICSERGPCSSTQAIRGRTALDSTSAIVLADWQQDSYPNGRFTLIRANALSAKVRKP